MIDPARLGRSACRKARIAFRVCHGGFVCEQRLQTDDLLPRSLEQKLGRLGSRAWTHRTSVSKWITPRATGYRRTSRQVLVRNSSPWTSTGFVALPFRETVSLQRTLNSSCLTPSLDR